MADPINAATTAATRIEIVMTETSRAASSDGNSLARHARRTLLLVCGHAMAMTLAAQDAPTACTVLPSARDTVLAMSYEAFDQTKAQGWRHLAERRCYAAAAALLDAYRERHAPRLPDGATRMLAWHAGQMFAFADDYGAARPRMRASLNPTEPTSAAFPWNDYVLATLAFLDGDADALSRHHDRIARSLSKGNLSVVVALRQHLGQPYRVAYPP
jgi:hypothetical protein